MLECYQAYLVCCQACVYAFEHGFVEVLALLVLLVAFSVDYSLLRTILSVLRVALFCAVVAHVCDDCNEDA